MESFLGCSTSGITVTPVFPFDIVSSSFYVLMAKQLSRQVSAPLGWAGAIHISPGLLDPGAQNPCLAER